MSWNNRIPSEPVTKHTHPVCFGRREAGCPRCAELSNGAEPRSGWGSLKKQNEQRELARVADYFAPGGEYSRQTPIQQMMDTRFES